jgi:probable F420-dependent oxidoreductase
MTEGVSLKPDLGRYGVFWVGGSPDADLNWVEPALAETSTLQLATGIVNIWASPAAEVAKSFERIESAYPGRFLLGVGVGHPEHTDVYKKPYDALVEYLDELDGAGLPTSRRVLAALGPKVLALSAERSAGAHPYLTTPEHTAQARELVGNTVFLAPEHKVVLTENTNEAREIGRRTVEFYLDLSNYVNNWRRLGFTDTDVRKPGSDKLIDAVVAHGTPERVAARLSEHLESGADHVAIQVLGGPDGKLLGALEALAGPLGLTPQS